MKIDEKITNEIERAISNYNSAIKKLTAKYTHENERKAHGAMKYLRGLCNMLFITSDIFVTFDYLDTTYYSEIVAYNTTVTTKK